MWQRAYNETLPFQEISPKLAELATRLAKPAVEDEDFKAEAAIVNFYGPGMLRENADCLNDYLQFQFGDSVYYKLSWKYVLTGVAKGIHCLVSLFVCSNIKALPRICFELVYC